MNGFKGLRMQPLFYVKLFILLFDKKGIIINDEFECVTRMMKTKGCFL